MERVGGEKATSPRYNRTKRINALGVAFFNFCKLCQPASKNNRNYALLNTRKKKKRLLLLTGLIVGPGLVDIVISGLLVCYMTV